MVDTRAFAAALNRGSVVKLATHVDGFPDLKATTAHPPALRNEAVSPGGHGRNPQLGGWALANPVDAIDLNRLRHYPLMRLAVARCPESWQALVAIGLVLLRLAMLLAAWTVRNVLTAICT